MKKSQQKSRELQGMVISDKMDKTIVVVVERVKMHPKYKKYYKSRKNYKVHDEKNEFHVGDSVAFVECRPISKEKHWRALKKLSAKN